MIYITTVYYCRYLTWWVSSRPNAIKLGECSISLIELLYNIIINKYILVFFYIYLIVWMLICDYLFHVVLTRQSTGRKIDFGEIKRNRKKYTQKNVSITCNSFVCLCVCQCVSVCVCLCHICILLGVVEYVIVSMSIMTHEVVS